jgi:hypothetical protein
MISIEGTLVKNGDAKTLVDLLLRTDTYESSVAAAIVNQALIDQTNAVALTSDDLAAIAYVLKEDAPKGLRPLRDALRRLIERNRS